MKIPTLTEEGARQLVQSPIINLAGLAAAFYDDGRARPDQALRKRVLLSPSVSLATRERLTEVVSGLLTAIGS
jgi:hypothetical protein